MTDAALFKKLVYRKDEVMEMLSIGKSKFYELLASGELVGHNEKPGLKGLRVTAASIKAYVEKHEIPTEFWVENDEGAVKSRKR